MRVHLRSRDRIFAADVQQEGDHFRVALDGSSHVVDVQQLDSFTMLLAIDGQRCRVAIARRGHERLVHVGGEVYTLLFETTAAAHQLERTLSPEITAPMPGKVLQVLARAGDRVGAGDVLLVLEAMKMETRLTAEASGTVTCTRVEAGDMVDGGQVLVVIEYD